MFEGLIENKSIKCTNCQAGPWYGRESEYVENGDLVTECTWICGRCGAKFSNGIISREPKK